MANRLRQPKIEWRVSCAVVVVVVRGMLLVQGRVMVTAAMSGDLEENRTVGGCSSLYCG